jgi:hypothetical protein
LLTLKPLMCPRRKDVLRRNLFKFVVVLQH